MQTAPYINISSAYAVNFFCVVCVGMHHLIGKQFVAAVHFNNLKNIQLGFRGEVGQKKLPFAPLVQRRLLKYISTRDPTYNDEATSCTQSKAILYSLHKLLSPSDPHPFSVFTSLKYYRRMLQTPAR